MGWLNHDTAIITLYLDNDEVIYNTLKTMYTKIKINKMARCKRRKVGKTRAFGINYVTIKRAQLWENRRERLDKARVCVRVMHNNNNNNDTVFGRPDGGGIRPRLPGDLANLPEWVNNDTHALGKEKRKRYIWHYKYVYCKKISFFACEIIARQ